jgi:Ras family protein A
LAFKQWATNDPLRQTRVPIVVVGLKTDLRPIDIEKLKNYEGMTEQSGRRMAEVIGAYGYVECSAERNDGVQRVFDVAAITGSKPTPVNFVISGDSGCKYRCQ